MSEYVTFDVEVTMPRPARLLEEGGIYHVYNRVGGEGMPFVDEDLAGRFVQLLRNVVERDGMVVFAWVLMGNHFHVVVRMGAAPLSRSMKTVQQEVTRAHNRKAKIYGPLWQGRFKAKRVVDEGYLRQLIAYVHLNPVTAGIVDVSVPGFRNLESCDRFLAAGSIDGSEAEGRDRGRLVPRVQPYCEWRADLL